MWCRHKTYGSQRVVRTQIHIVIDALKHQAQGRPLHLAKEQQHEMMA